MRAAVLVLSVVVAAGQMSAQDSPAPITGRIFDALGDQPLRRARVTVTAGGGERLAETFTDNDGRFLLTAVGSSPLTLRVTKARYATTTLTLQRSDDRRDLRLALTRSAAVMGRVVDESGLPLPLGAYVYVTARLINGSTRLFTRVDTLGDYRLGGLPAGRYEITAVRLRPENSAGGPELENLLFGPRDSVDAGRTLMLTLSGGDELAVDFAAPASAPDLAPPCAAPVEADRPATRGARISGRVITTAGQPVPCPQVRVEGYGDYVFGDPQGRYVLEGLPPGAYRVRAAAFTYRTMRYGQRRPGDEDAFVLVDANEQRGGIDVTLARDGVVSGTVVDEHGEPIEGIQVRAVSIRTLMLRNVASFSGGAVTDDRGQFRLIGVPPGTYAIGAQVTGEISTFDLERGYVSTYSPATTDLAAARQITVDVDREVSGVDIVLMSAVTGTIAGTVLDPAGRPYSGTLSVSARPMKASLDLYTARVTPAGTFELHNIPQGDYVLTAVASRRPESAPFALEYVSVVDGSPVPVTLRFTEGARLEGRLTVDIAPDINRAGLELTFSSPDRDFARAPGLTTPMWGPEPDGTFWKTGLVGPARIALRRMPACDSCFLKSALIDGLDAADRPFDFGRRGGTYRDLEIVISDAGAALAGRVTDARGRAVAGAVIPVISVHEDLRFPGSRHAKSGFSEEDGSFAVAGLPPGDYLVGAFNELPGIIEQELADPALAELLAARGQRVTLVERERRTLDLRRLAR